MADPITSTTYICSGSTYGGVGDGFTIASGAALNVGSANDEHAGAGTITSGSALAGAEVNIFSDGIANMTFVSSGATLNIYSGGSCLQNSSNRLVMLQSGAVVNVSGGFIGATATNITLSATNGAEINVYDGGRIYRIGNRASVNVYSGAITTRTMNSLETVYDGGQSISGYFTNGSSYALTVKSGGSAKNVQLAGSGWAIVESGGYISALACAQAGTNVPGSGRKVIIYEGGTISRFAANVGSAMANLKEGDKVLTVDISGGKIFNITSGFHTIFNLSSGYVSQAVFTSGGVFNVYGGSATNVILDTVTEGITPPEVNVTGGQLDNITVNAGTLAVTTAGVVSGAAINAGTMTLGGGGSALDVTTVAGGVITLAGGFLVGSQTLAAGTIQIGDTIREDASVIGTTLTGFDVISGGSVGFGSGFALDGNEIADDAALFLADGATGNNLVVNGTLHVSSGALTTAATVNSTLVVLSGGSAIGTVNNRYIRASAGGVISDTTINSGGSITLFGSADGTTINSTGLLAASDGAVVTDTVINSAGRMTLLNGALASGVWMSGYRDESGSQWAKVSVGNGASATDITLLVGAVYVNSGATVTDVDLVKADEAEVRMQGGVASGIAVSGVVDGRFGTIYAAEAFSGGTVNIYNSSGESMVAYDTVGNFGGAIHVSANNILSRWGGAGSAYNTLLHSGAGMYLNGATSGIGETAETSYGLAKDTVVESGASLTIKTGGGRLDGTTVLGGRMTLNGSAIAESGDAKIVFAVDQNKSGGASLISNYSLMDTNFSYFLTIDAAQSGTYALASNATTFDKTLSTTVSNGNKFSLTLDGTYTDYTAGKDYTLALNSSDTLGVTVTATANELTETETKTTVAVNTVDQGAKWGDTAMAGTLGQVIAWQGASSSGNLYLDIDTTTATAAQIYAGSFDGTANITLADGTVGAIMGGAADNTGSVNNTNIKLGAGAKATVVYGAARGNVAGDVNIDVAEGTVVAGQLFGGAVLLSTATGNIDINGTVSLNISGGVFSSSVVGGGRVNGGTATGTETISGGVVIDVTGGTFYSSQCVYGGGFAVGNGSTENEIVVSNGVNINWNGGVYQASASGGWAVAGRGVFGGALAADGASALVEGGTTITVNSGSITNVFGGGWAQNSGASTVSGDVNITVSDGTIRNIFGGGAHASGTTGTTIVDGDVSITVSGGSVTTIYVGGQTTGDSVTGNATVTISGSDNFSTLCNGTGYNGADTVTGTTTFALDGYTGSYNGSISNFDAITVGGETAATLTGAEITNTAWTLNLAENSGAAAMLTWEETGSLTDTMALNVSTANAVESGWNLIAGSAETVYTGTAYKLSIDDADAFDLELGTAVSGTGTVFDGYTLFEDDASNTLKFAKISA